MIRKFVSSPRIWCALVATRLRGTTAWNSARLGCNDVRFTPQRLFTPPCSDSLLFSSIPSASSEPLGEFKRGDKIQVEVISFGPLGASVVVVGRGHDQSSLIPADDEPLGSGLIFQKEISYFRQKRDGVDVVLGEILPAYVEEVRDDLKLNIGLRTFGGKAKSSEIGELVLQTLEMAPEGTIPIGDKSSPQEIGKRFPGVSKASFKKAIGSLYRQGLVKPGPNSISLMK